MEMANLVTGAVEQLRQQRGRKNFLRTAIRCTVSPRRERSHQPLTFATMHTQPGVSNAQTGRVQQRKNVLLYWAACSTARVVHLINRAMWGSVMRRNCDMHVEGVKSQAHTWTHALAHQSGSPRGRRAQTLPRRRAGG